MRYKSTDWSLDVPQGWICESDEDCTSFTHPQGVGAFQVSSFRKGNLVTVNDLREFAGDMPLSAVVLGGLSGFRTRFSDNGRFWIMWWLRAGRQMIHVTYNCSLAVRGREDAEVRAMIESLTPEHDTNAG